uniref:Integrase catalytic domain-containing protein n=1 Tax=Knipowitschia caucasica TaxID=637954 RepID=A0AAV2JU37_KNICA
MPLPLTDTRCFSTHLAGTTIFSKVDLVLGYHQVPVNPQDMPKTAVVRPFSLKGAAPTFQLLMDNVLRDLSFLFVYLDNILVASASAEVEAIIDFPGPNTVKPLQEFLGMVNFYNRHLPRGAHLMRWLYEALRDKGPTDSVDWSAEMTGAFEATKAALANTTLLAHPSLTAPVALTTDASDYAVGAVCEQWVRGAWQPSAFFSKKLHDNERKYSTFDRELLGLFLATHHFRFLLEGQQFTAFVDHKPLTFAMVKSTEPWSGLRQRQLPAISEYTNRFGTPSDLSSDRGPQFTSELWTAFAEGLGVKVHRTTAFNPQSNGLCERFHQDMKAALKASLTGSDRVDRLPWVMLGLRSAPKEDLPSCRCS